MPPYSRENSAANQHRAAMNAGKKIKGRKRQPLVDAYGRALKPRVRTADIQKNRDAAEPLLRASGT